MSITPEAKRLAPLATPSGLGEDATRDLSAALTALLADVFALYLKTKNFHWHVSGPHFQDYHLLLDRQAEQIFAMTDPVAERARKLGGTTIRSIGHIARNQRVLDNDAPFVDPQDMLAELRDDNGDLATRLRELHALCEEYHDVVTASLIENWLDEAEGRRWFLFETGRKMPIPLERGSPASFRDGYAGEVQAWSTPCRPPRHDPGTAPFRCFQPTLPPPPPA
jgi:starvation-inducible DNA-binding protein